MIFFSENVEDLPRQYVARYNIVYAKLLYSCHQYINALSWAREALRYSKVSGTKTL